MVDIGFSIGSGALSSTAGDLYRWGVALHRIRLFDLDQQIEADWPYGWGKIEVGPHRGVEQTGALQGFMSSLAVFDCSNSPTRRRHVVRPLRCRLI
jgi:hypothetical protein